MVADEIAVAILVRAEPAASLSGCAALHARVGRFRRDASEALPACAELRPAARGSLRAAVAACAVVAEVRRGVHLAIAAVGDAHAVRAAPHVAAAEVRAALVAPAPARRALSALADGERGVAPRVRTAVLRRLAAAG